MFCLSLEVYLLFTNNSHLERKMKIDFKKNEEPYGIASFRDTYFIM
jgi:hypothetical protein